MPMYNLIKYSKNYRKTTVELLWNYYRDEPNSSTKAGINYTVENSKSFDYKTDSTGKLESNYLEKEGVEIVAPLKYLSNFWRPLDMPLINFEVSLTLTWCENCVLTSKAYRDQILVTNPPTAGVNNPTSVTHTITNNRLYVPVVPLSDQDDNRRLEQLKTGFKRKIKWNKYRSEMTNQTKTDNLNYLVDPTFSKVNRFFVLSFENEIDRKSYFKHYTPAIEIKDFNVVINRKIFFAVLVKHKEETYEKIIGMSRNNDYTTSNLLNYQYFFKSLQTNFNRPKQTN